AFRRSPAFSLALLLDTGAFLLLASAHLAGYTALRISAASFDRATATTDTHRVGPGRVRRSGNGRDPRLPARGKDRARWYGRGFSCPFVAHGPAGGHQVSRPPSVRRRGPGAAALRARGTPGQPVDPPEHRRGARPRFRATTPLPRHGI